MGEGRDIKKKGKSKEDREMEENVNGYKKMQEDT